MKPQLLNFLFSLALFISGLSCTAQAQSETWVPDFSVEFSSRNIYATDNYYLATYKKQLQIHDTRTNRDTFVNFSSAENLHIHISTGDIFVVGDFNQGRFWFSFNQGVSWDSIWGNSHLDIAIKNQNEFLMTDFNRTSKSTDGGKTWQTRTFSGSSANRSVNGNHVLLLFSDRIEISNDFGSTFQSRPMDIFNGNGDISADGHILLSISQFGKGPVTLLSKNNGNSWDTVNKTKLPNIRWINATYAVCFYDELSRLVDLSSGTVCYLDFNGNSRLGYSYLNAQILDDNLFVLGKNLVKIPFSQIKCFDEKPINNPNIKLDWSFILHSSEVDVLPGLREIHQIEDRVLFRGQTSKTLYTENFDDTLAQYNLFLMDTNGTMLKVFSEKMAPYSYNPYLYPLPKKAGYAHQALYRSDTSILSPDRSNFYINSDPNRRSTVISLLNKDLEYITHFRFESAYANSLQANFSTDGRFFYYSVYCDGPFEFIDIDGNMTALNKGYIRLKLDEKGNKMSITKWSSQTFIPLQDGQYILRGLLTSGGPYDSIVLFGIKYPIQNPKKARNYWVLIDSMDQVQEVFLLENSSGNSIELDVTHPDSDEPNSIVQMRSTEAIIITDTKGGRQEFSNLADRYYYLKFLTNGTFETIGKSAHVQINAVEGNHHFFSFSARDSVTFDFQSERGSKTQSISDHYFTLYDSSYHLLGNIGALGSTAKMHLIEAAYPSLYFSAIIVNDQASIPGNQTHTPILESYVFGKISLNTNLSSNEKLNSPYVNIFPNPTHNWVTLQSSEQFQHQVNVAIYSLDGKRVSDYCIESSENILRVNLESLPIGWYLIKLDDSNHSNGFLILKH